MADEILFIDQFITPHSMATQHSLVQLGGVVASHLFPHLVVVKWFSIAFR